MIYYDDDVWLTIILLLFDTLQLYNNLCAFYFIIMLKHYIYTFALIVFYAADFYKWK